MLDDLTDAIHNLVQHKGSVGLGINAAGSKSNSAGIQRLATPGVSGPFRDTNAGWQRSRWKPTRKSERRGSEGPGAMRGDYVSGVTVLLEGSSRYFNLKNTDWDLRKSLALKEANCGFQGTAIKCAKEQVRMASSAERYIRERLMRLGPDDPDSRKHMDHHRDNWI